MIDRRLANQHLIGRPLATPRAVVERLGAVQAQDYAGAKWAIGQRAGGATDAEVEAALDDGALLRTHVLRPTWHIVPAADIRWMLELTAPRVRARMAVYDRRLGLDDAVFARSNRALEDALRGGRHVTRTEAAEILKHAGIDAVETQRLGHIMMRAELDGVVVSGVRRGKQSTYALLDVRAPDAPRLARDEALCKLATIYFATRGPATLQDFSWWSGLMVADARAGVEAAGTALRSEQIHGREYWSGPPRRIASPASPLVRLLSNYDEYFIAYKDRTALSATPVKRQWAPALNDHVLSIDGRLVGRWTREFKKSEVVVDVMSSRRLTRGDRDAVVEQGERFGSFMQRSARVRIT